MVSELMAFPKNSACEVRVAGHRVTGDEERCPHVLLAQHGEHGVRVDRHRTVVERERYDGFGYRHGCDEFTEELRGPGAGQTPPGHETTDDNGDGEYRKQHGFAPTWFHRFEVRLR
jgi:hypothetical protein